MISVRTPLRISFFGGGTDYPAYFDRHPGAVLGMTIDRYVYTNAISLLDVINYKYRIAYSKLELTNNINDIEHSLVRAVLQNYKIQGALDISIQSDLPGASGLGSSSSLAVGLINMISHLNKRSMTRLDLAQSAIEIEQVILKENVGVQDQLHAAFGGINRFDFYKGRIRITPLQMHTPCLEALLESIVLIYTGHTRSASNIAQKQIQSTKRKKLDQELAALVSLVDQSVSILESKDPKKMLHDFSILMEKGWTIKRKLSSDISSQSIDTLYKKAILSGALSGKLCGAGGGGFLLMIVPIKKRKEFEKKMNDHCLIPVGMDKLGSVLIL